jgi:hypothetical protein
MTKPSRILLRRKDARRHLNCIATVECHGVSRKIKVVDFSASGLRVDEVAGLATGDRVLIVFAPGLSVERTIIWSVRHKAGLKLSAPLAENDPVYIHLAKQAASIEHARTRAIAALAKQHSKRVEQLDT